jgi:uncharacterized membrane protein YgcG
MAVLMTGLASVLIVAASAALLAGGKKADIASRWRDRDITIDGANTEWQGAMAPVKDAPLSMGVFNDDRFFYLCLVTGNRNAAGQIRRQGLIVWLDRDGGKKKQFGLEFPIPMRGMSLIDPASGAEDGGGTRMPLEADQDRVAILGSQKNDRRDIGLRDLQGIQVKIAESDGVLVYELKVPLNKSADNPYAVGVPAGAIVKVSFQTPEFRPPAEGRGALERSGGGGTGGRGGMGGRGGTGGMGGGGREGGRGNFEMPKPIKFSTTVQLATAH